MFNYTDHLEGGALKKCPVNIFSERARWREERVSYGKDPATNVLKILEENHYYPFGMKHQNYNVDHLDFNHYPGTGVALVPLPAVANVSYNYKYNGKELQEELGLNMYDYGARNYDPALGRWMNIDPLAETSRRWSPYNYAYNNPMIFVDPDGMETERFDGVEYNKNRGGHWSDAYRDTGSDNSNKENSAGKEPPKRKSWLGRTWDTVKSWFSSDDEKPKGKSYVIMGEPEVTFEKSDQSLSTVIALGGIRTGATSTVFSFSAIASGLLCVPLLFNGDTDRDRSKTMYLYRNMRSVGGIPQLGESLNTLGLRPVDVNNLPNSAMISPTFNNGLSVTVGYGNTIPMVKFGTGNTILFRIPASDVLPFGLMPTPMPSTGDLNYARITPLSSMSVGQFKTIIQATAPLWKPVK